jgi:hypothetical protein
METPNHRAIVSLDWILRTSSGIVARSQRSLYLTMLDCCKSLQLYARVSDASSLMALTSDAFDKSAGGLVVGVLRDKLAGEGFGKNGLAEGARIRVSSAGARCRCEIPGS